MSNALTHGIDASPDDMRTVHDLRATSMIGLDDTIVVGGQPMTVRAAMMAAKEREAKFKQRHSELLAARVELGELLVQIRDAMGIRGDMTQMMTLFGINRNIAHKAMKLARVKRKDPVKFAAAMSQHSTLRGVEQAVGVRCPERPRMAVMHEVIIRHMGVDADDLLTAVNVRPAHVTCDIPVFREGARDGTGEPALDAAHATAGVLAAGGGVAAASTDVGASRCKDVAGQLTLRSLYEAATQAIDSMQRLIARAKQGDAAAADELQGMLQKLG
jgi:hypothetical protein